MSHIVVGVDGSSVRSRRCASPSRRPRCVDSRFAPSAPGRSRSRCTPDPPTPPRSSPRSIGIPLRKPLGDRSTRWSVQERRRRLSWFYARAVRRTCWSRNPPMRPCWWWDPRPRRLHRPPAGIGQPSVCFARPLPGDDRSLRRPPDQRLMCGSMFAGWLMWAESPDGSEAANPARRRAAAGADKVGRRAIAALGQG